MSTPTIPLRRSSAGRRRRHCKQLPFRIGQIAPGAWTVLLTPVWVDPKGVTTRKYLAVVRDQAGQRLRLPATGSARLAALLQAAHPEVDWDRAVTWRADSNTVTRWHADYAASITTGLTQSYADWENATFPTTTRGNRVD